MINRDDRGEDEKKSKFWGGTKWDVQDKNKKFSVLAISKLSKPTKPTGGKSVLNTPI
jgi:hypothetical protein